MARKTAPSKQAPRRKRRRWPWFMLRWSLVLASWAVLFGLVFLGWLAYDLPDVSRLNEIRKQPSITLLADDGTVIATYGDLYGANLRIEDLPPYLPEAVLATEDRRFYSHFGLDPVGLVRAVYVNIRDWQLSQGGSTITQQLAKNIFLTPARTIRRKGQEMLLALWLERNFSKDEILALYLNRVYFGAGTYGVDAAARKFFGKSAAQVSPYEAAMLAGLLRAPSLFNPMNDRKTADGRALLVLDNMVAADYLTVGEAAAIAKGKGAAVSYAASGNPGRHFADWVVDQVSSYIGFVDRDLVVVTTLDTRLQAIAEAELTKLLTEKGPESDVGQAALVSLTPDGAVRAMVGGRDYGGSQFNRATQSLRQPGSAFKAFVFLAGFENGLYPDSVMFDGPIQVGEWKPRNYKDDYRGEVSLREAYARSLNSVAVQVSERIGRKKVVEAARRLGITAELTPGPSIALGSSGVSLLELTGAYATFDNLGNGVWPRGIEQIRDRAGALLYQREGSGPGPVVEAQPVIDMLDVMTSVVHSGTGRAAREIDRPAAGKTGTGQEFRDAWFIGFTAELVTGVWMGNDDNSPMKNVTGGSLPTLLWRNFMERALEGQPARPLPVPEPPDQIAVLLPTLDDSASPAIPPANASDAEGESESLQEWLDSISHSKGSKK